MDTLKYLFCFVLGGTITTGIVLLEEAGYPLLSRLAALTPVFTWLSYLMLSSTQSTKEVAAHSKFVLIGTLVAWVPYMALISYLAPRIGTYRAVGIAVTAFMLLATILSLTYPI